MKILELCHVILARIMRVGVAPEDDENIRLQKTTFVALTFVNSIPSLIWGIIYLFFDEPLAGSIPLFGMFFTIANLIILNRTGHFQFYRFSQSLMILLLPFLLMVALGGFINGSAVILVALFAPIGAFLSGQSREAVYWLLAYFILVVISGLIHPYLRIENNLPKQAIILFFVLNVGSVSSTTFFALNYFVKQKNLVIELMHKNRELEDAYLQQEIMLRQNEKLATLGKLSAGVAHELNNPAAATQRAVAQLQNSILKLEQAEFSLGQLNLSAAQLKALESHIQLIQQLAKQPVFLDPLARSDQEYEVEALLEDKGVEEAWEFAPTLVNIGYGTEELVGLANQFTNGKFLGVVVLLSNLYTARNLLAEIGQGTGRIIEIVKALKSYTYLDQAPIQSIDIHEGLNNTLVMLRSKLKGRIEVLCDYARDLPCIDAYGSEINQVWTNIIDNAISAMEGQGTLTLKTFQEDKWIVVEIQDTGSGIPSDIQDKIFDPFFTTKPPGEGTGLGLNISHNIIVQKHKGEIAVFSSPGETCFQIKLPISIEEA